MNDRSLRLIQEFPSGVRVETIQPAPGFQPLESDDEQLIANGYPPRPIGDDPDRLRRWERLAASRAQLIVPNFALHPERSHGPARTIGDTDTSSNWSGAYVTVPADQSLQWIEGSFNVPGPYVPQVPNPYGTWYCSSWIGIDGWGSSDVLQAGIESDVTSIQGSGVTRNTYTWWEWYPENEVQITNFPTSPGDFLFVEVYAVSSASAIVYIYNRNTDKAVNLRITPPAGTSLTGNSAEWVVERPAVNNLPTHLARYGAVVFDSAQAGTSGTTAFANTGTTIDMTGDAGQTISTGEFGGDKVVECAFLQSGEN